MTSLDVLPVVRSADDLVRFADAAVTASGSNLWWRGQADADWDLVPKVFRGDRGFRYEKNAVVHFVNRAPARFAATPERRDKLGWLQFMQHYGAPTRLLDWSESPLIAAFFATTGAPPDKASAIWVLDPFRMNQAMHGKMSLLGAEFPEVAKLVNPPFSDDAAEAHGVAAFFPQHVDLRLLVQLASFTIHGTTEPLNKWSGSESFVHRCVIPADAKATIFNQLFRLGIRRSTLFPDLTNLSAEIDAMRFQEQPSTRPPLTTIGAPPADSDGPPGIS